MYAVHIEGAGGPGVRRSGAKEAGLKGWISRGMRWLGSEQAADGALGVVAGLGVVALLVAVVSGLCVLMQWWTG